MTSNSSPNSPDNSLSRGFKGIWIPKEIWLHAKLSIQAKVLWAEIDSLYNEERGGCFATDPYLMKFLNVGASRLQEVLKELRDNKLLVSVNSDRRNRLIKAVNPSICGDLIPAIAGNRNPQKRGSKPLKSGEPIYKDYNKEDSKERERGEPLPPPPKEPAEKKEEKKERAIHVKTTEKEHESLVKDFGDATTQECYEELSLWKQNTPRSKWKLSDNLSIRNWVIKRVQEKKASHQSSRPSQNNLNQDRSPQSRII